MFLATFKFFFQTLRKHGVWRMNPNLRSTHRHGWLLLSALLLLSPPFLLSVFFIIKLFDFSSSMQLPHLAFVCCSIPGSRWTGMFVEEVQLAFGREAQDGPRGAQTTITEHIATESAHSAGQAFFCNPSACILKFGCSVKRKKRTPTYIS
ncbi:hypothetical protein Peur_056987 [Populus x canadensis]